MAEECIVRRWTEYNTEIETKGVLEKGLKYCFLPQENELIMHPMILHDARGNKIIYAPEQTHGNILKSFFTDLAKAQKYRVTILKKILSKGDTEPLILSCEIKATGSIDPTVFNNSISPQFASDSSELARSKVLEFLADLSDTQKFTQILLGFFIGLPSGCALMFIGYILLKAVT